MAEPRGSTCSLWAATADLCSPCDGDYTMDAGLLEDAIQVASDVLYVLSGRQFPGVCSDTVQILRSCIGDYARTTRSDQLTLGVSPLLTVDKVTLDGDEVAASLYEVRDHRWLTRLDDPAGTNPGWAFEDTLEVELTYGMSPPPAGVRAAAALACQLHLSCQPESASQCTLPKRVSSVTRQGVSMVMLDPFDFLENGRTGVYEADLFLAAYNPGGVRRPAVFASPDIPPRTHRVTHP